MGEKKMEKEEMHYIKEFIDNNNKKLLLIDLKLYKQLNKIAKVEEEIIKFLNINPTTKNNIKNVVDEIKQYYKKYQIYLLSTLYHIQNEHNLRKLPKLLKRDQINTCPARFGLRYQLYYNKHGEVVGVWWNTCNQDHDRNIMRKIAELSIDRIDYEEEMPWKVGYAEFKEKDNDTYELVNYLMYESEPGDGGDLVVEIEWLIFFEVTPETIYRLVP